MYVTVLLVSKWGLWNMNKEVDDTVAYAIPLMNCTFLIMFFCQTLFTWRVFHFRLDMKLLYWTFPIFRSHSVCPTIHSWRCCWFLSSNFLPFWLVFLIFFKPDGTILLNCFCFLFSDLAESDLSYTHGLMNQGVEDYKDKTCLILGGGDGALLHELLKEDPKHVTMIDVSYILMK